MPFTKQMVPSVFTLAEMAEVGRLVSEFSGSGEAVPLGQAKRNNYKNFFSFLGVRIGVGVLGQFI